MISNRVVITGIGIISSIGNNYIDVYKSLLNIKSGIIFSSILKDKKFKSNVFAPIKKKK